MLNKERNPKIEKVILEDYTDDMYNRSEWTRNFQTWWRMYDSVVSAKKFPFENASNLSIPILVWTADAIHSRLINPIFSTDDLIDVRGMPSGNDVNSKQLAQFLNWQLKTQMDFFNTIDETFHRTIFCGSWFVKVLHSQRIIKTKVRGFQLDQPEFTTQWQELYNGPEVESVNPLDLILPVDCVDIDTCEHLMHRKWLTIDDLVYREKLGIYENISSNLEKLEAALRYREDSSEGELILPSRINTKPNQGRRIWLEVLECIYKYDADGDGLAEDWLFTVVKDANLLVRSTELVDVFASGRRPWVHFKYKLALKGPYGRGLGQELIDLNTEVNAIFNQMTDAGTLSLAPIIVTRPDSEAAAQIKKQGGIYPGMHIQTEDPQRDIQLIQFTPNLSFGIQDVQFLLGFTERVSTISDMQLGRSSDQPNTPRTYGQSALIAEGGSEAQQTIQLRFRKALTEIVKRVFWLDKSYMSRLTYYRVTGEDGKEALASIDAADMQGEYDFSIVPMSANRNKMAERQQKLQAIQFILPLIDRAKVDPTFFKLVKLVWETFDLAKLEDIIGFGDDAVRTEHVNLLKQKAIQVSPYDDHMRHVQMHTQFMQEAAEEGQQNIMQQMQQHIASHIALASQSAPPGQNGAANGVATPGKAMQSNNPISQMQGSRGSEAVGRN